MEIIALAATRRRCPVCGASLEDRHLSARTCGSACRRELSRVRRLIAGHPDGPYACLRDYTSRRTHSDGSARSRGVQNALKGVR
jgi:hypothetical protein